MKRLLIITALVAFPALAEDPQVAAPAELSIDTSLSPMEYVLHRTDLVDRERTFKMIGGPNPRCFLMKRFLMVMGNSNTFGPVPDYIESQGWEKVEQWRKIQRQPDFMLNDAIRVFKEFSRDLRNETINEYAELHNAGWTDFDIGLIDVELDAPTANIRFVPMMCKP